MTKSPPLSNRLLWLDAVRGLAVLGMLETHAVNTLLAPAWKGNAVFPWLAFFNGLVAPAFLWIAGYAQGVAWNRRLDRGERGWPARTFKRLAGVWLIGHALHLPWGLTVQAWREFLAVDVLQCLSVSLLLTLAIQKTCHPRGALALGGACAITLILGLLPTVPRTGFWPLDAYFDQTGASLFPLVPWTAFVFLGALMAQVERLAPGGDAASGSRGLPQPGDDCHARGQGGRVGHVPPAVWLGAAGVALAFTPQPGLFSKSHPAFFLERLGWLFGGVAVVIGLGRVIRFPRWLLLAGRESLVIYVAHLLLLHSLPFADRYRQSLAPWQVGLVVSLLALVSLGLAWVAQRWNRRSPSTQVACTSNSSSSNVRSAR